MSRSVRQMYQCYECATCTTTPPTNGVTLCDKHQDQTWINTTTRPIHLPTDKETV